MPRKAKSPAPEAALLAHGATHEERQEAARQMALKRWGNTTAKQKSLHGEWLLSHRNPDNAGRPIDRKQPRCPCKRMTLKRARARGQVKTGHHQSCTFHQA